jgi:arylsulfatase A-like enzyme
VRRCGWALVLSATAVLFVAGCRRKSAEHRRTLDPRLVDPSPSTAQQLADGGPSTLTLGIGWYGVDHGQAGSWRWASSSAIVYFACPRSGDLEFVARGAPFTFRGAPRQTLTPVLNGHVLPPVEVTADWQELRFPLPVLDLRVPINQLELRFAYAKAPAAVMRSDDVRELSAMFAGMAVLPKDRPFSDQLSSIRAMDGRAYEANLGRSGLAIPLPAGSHVALQIGRVRSEPNGVQMSIYYQNGSQRTKRVWFGAATAVAESTLTFPDPVAGPSMAVLELEPSAGPPQTDARVQFEFFAPVVSRPTVSRRLKPDIFLYLVDTLRADELGAYGSSLGLTPRIDGFSRDGVVFKQASSSAPWTLPATVSILSGVYPFEHGATDLGKTVPESGLPWLPEELTRLGYETAGFSQWPFANSFGADRGFDRYYLDVRLFDKSRSEDARELLWQHLLHRAHPEQPLFAYIHVSDTHAVYDPKGGDRRLAEQHPGRLLPQLYNPQIFLAEGFGKEAADTAHLHALYQGEVQYADRQFGAFLDLLRDLSLYDESLVILVSDHGEEFFEHHGFDHGRTLYEELLHVPLIVKFPENRFHGGYVSTRVSSLDLAPTILQLLGQSTGELRLHGSALPSSDERANRDREVFAETQIGPSRNQGAVDLLGVATGDVKCVSNRLGRDRFGKPAPESEVYDLKADPAERSPLAASDARAQSCQDRLARWIARASAASKRRNEPVRPLPPEEIRRLRALGYLR